MAIPWDVNKTKIFLPIGQQEGHVLLSIGAA